MPSTSETGHVSQWKNEERQGVYWCWISHSCKRKWQGAGATSRCPKCPRVRPESPRILSLRREILWMGTVLKRKLLTSWAVGPLLSSFKWSVKKGIPIFIVPKNHGRVLSTSMFYVNFRKFLVWFGMVGEVWEAGLKLALALFLKYLWTVCLLTWKPIFWVMCSPVPGNISFYLVAIL